MSDGMSGALARMSAIRSAFGTTSLKWWANMAPAGTSPYPKSQTGSSFEDVLKSAGSSSAGGATAPAAAATTRAGSDLTLARLQTLGGGRSTARTEPWPAGLPERAKAYEDEFRAAAEETGVPLQILLAVAWAESAFRPTAVSPAGAQGLMQLMPGTAADLGVDPSNPAQNILGGARYLATQYQAFGSWEQAFAAYNAGPGAVQRYGGIPPFAETRNYIATISEYLSRIGGTTKVALAPASANLGAEDLSAAGRGAAAVVESPTLVVTDPNAVAAPRNPSATAAAPTGAANGGHADTTAAVAAPMVTDAAHVGHADTTATFAPGPAPSSDPVTPTSSSASPSTSGSSSPSFVGVPADGVVPNGAAGAASDGSTGHQGGSDRGPATPDVLEVARQASVAATRSTTSGAGPDAAPGAFDAQVAPPPGARPVIGVGAPVAGLGAQPAMQRSSLAPEATTSPVLPAEVSQQLLDEIQKMRTAGGGTHRLVIRLDPPELGNVRVHFELRGGDVHVILRPERPEAGSLLNAQRDQVASVLQREGLQLSQFDVRAGADQRGGREHLWRTPHRARSIDLVDGTPGASPATRLPDGLRL